MLLDIILDIRWIVHHPSEHRYSRDLAGVDYCRCSAVACVDEASLSLQHVNTKEKICLTIRNNSRYLRVPLSEAYVSAYGTIPYSQSFLSLKPCIVSFL